MSLTDHPDERERLHRAIAESQKQIEDCPQVDNGWSAGGCRTCVRHRKYIEDYREALAALDADEAATATDDPMELVTRVDWPEQPYEPEYVDVPAGAFKHPGDQVYGSSEATNVVDGWGQAPMKDWGDRVPEGQKTRRIKSLDAHLPTIIDKAERIAKRMSDPAKRERLLYTITQQTMALARNIQLVIEDIKNAAYTDTVLYLQRTSPYGRAEVPGVRDTDGQCDAQHSAPCPTAPRLSEMWEQTIPPL